MAEKKRVLVVEDSIELCDAIVQYFRKKDDFELLPPAYDGEDGLRKAAQADIAIVDLILPRLDGFSLLERISSQEGKRPDVIVISALGTQEVVQRACALGAKYFLVKPFHLESIYRRTLDISGYRDLHPSAPNPVVVNAANRSLDEKITNIFLTVGIPAHIKGYHYLRCAIRLVIENNGLMNRITKELYPAIAEQFDTSPSKVERAIRHAIDVAWSRGKIENINHIFGFNIYSKNDKPTNGEFIALVADKLLMERTA